MMNSYYHAGRILGHLQTIFGDRITPVALGNSVTITNRIPVIMRHIWSDALRDESFIDLLHQADLPTQPASGEQQADVWLGFYHRRHEMRK